VGEKVRRPKCFVPSPPTPWVRVVCHASKHTAPGINRQQKPAASAGEFWEELRAGLGGVHDLTEAQLQAIGDHVRLLLAWNAAINLSGIRAPETIATEHVLDSLTALPILRSAGVEEFVDIGSGGGFPDRLGGGSPDPPAAL